MKKRNRKSFGRLVSWQHNHEQEQSTDFAEGEQSPYWNWTERYSERNEDGEIVETSRANPDILPEPEDYIERRHFYQDQIEELAKRLSPRELEVARLLAEGREEEEIGAILGVSRSMVKLCRSRIRKKFKRLDTIEP